MSRGVFFYIFLIGHGVLKCGRSGNKPSGCWLYVDCCYDSFIRKLAGKKMHLGSFLCGPILSFRLLLFDLKNGSVFLHQFLCSWICTPLKRYLFGTFAWAFAPIFWEIGPPRLRITLSFLQDLSRAVSRFSRGPVAGSHRQHFFDPTWSNAITISDRIVKNAFFPDPIGDCNPVRSKKCWRWRPCYWAPGEAGSSSG